MQGVCVGRPFRGFETKVISLELDGRFQYNFVKGFILRRGLTMFCCCFLKSGGTTLEAWEVLVMLVIPGRRISRVSSAVLLEWDQDRTIDLGEFLFYFYFW